MKTKQTLIIKNKTATIKVYLDERIDQEEELRILKEDLENIAIFLENNKTCYEIAGELKKECSRITKLVFQETKGYSGVEIVYMN